jgi:hypothetical protein
VMGPALALAAIIKIATVVSEATRKMRLSVI